MSTQPNSPSTMVMNVIGRVVQATYSILWRSNTTTGNDTSDSYILHPSPQSPESTKDNSQPRTLQNVSPDGPIFPKYHSTPNPVSDLNIMSASVKPRRVFRIRPERRTEPPNFFKSLQWDVSLSL